MTTALTMDIARPAAAPPRLRPGRSRASSRRASRFATPRASTGAESSSDVPADAPLRVVIVGGGIGGLAACVALRRVGVDAHVYERATELRSNVGTGIALWPNGLKALRCIGPDVEREVASRGCAISGMRMGVVDEDQPQTQSDSPPSLASKLRDAAVSLAGAAFPKVMRARHGAGLVCIRWADAQAALASFLPPSVIHLDASIDAIDAVRFADGTEGVRCAFARRDGSDATDGVPVFADALVGADGVNSAVRAALLDDGPPRDNGRVIWRGVVDAAEVAAREERFREAASETNATNAAPSSSSSAAASGVFPTFCPEGATALKASKDSAVGRTVCYMDVGGGKLYWAAGCLDEGVVVDVGGGRRADEDAEAAANGASGSKIDEKGSSRASCAATFASYPDVLACLDATPRDDLYVSRVLDRPPLFPSDAAGWTGPVTLLGDAAHPVIPSFGQGANLALEDAAELATALANARREDIVGILREWERARYARTSEAQVASFLSGSKSYGARKFADAVAASGLTEDALAAHREKYPTANDSQTALMGWRPTTDSPLCELAPAAAMALARRAANEATREPRLPDEVNGGGGGGGGAGRRGTILGSLVAFAGFGASTDARASENVSASSPSYYEGDGFRFALPPGWTTEEVAGVSQSSARLFSPGSSEPSATLTREPTFTMGAQGLASMFPSAEAFGERVAGSRRGRVASTRDVAEGVFFAEGFDDDGPWAEMMACGCRSGEAAKKYNLMQTVRVSGGGGKEAVEGIRVVAESFELTAGTKCAPPN